MVSPGGTAPEQSSPCPAMGGSASPHTGAPGSMALQQPGNVAVTRSGAVSPASMWSARPSPTARPSIGGLQAAPVGNRGGSGRLPAAGGGSLRQSRASTSTPRWRDADGSNSAATGTVATVEAPPGGSSPQCPASTYTPRPPGVVPAALSASPRQAQSPRAMSPRPGGGAVFGSQLASGSITGGGTTDVQRRLAELERSMHDLRLDMDRNRNEVSAEIGRLGASVQELDVFMGDSDMRAEVAAIRNRLELDGRQTCVPAATCGTSSRSSSPGPLLRVRAPGECTDPQGDTSLGSSEKPASIAASLSKAAKGDLSEIVRTALSELERLSRLACESLEANQADRMTLRQRGLQQQEKSNPAMDKGENEDSQQVVQQISPSPVGIAEKKGANATAGKRIEVVATPLCRPGVTLTAVPLQGHSSKSSSASSTSTAPPHIEDSSIASTSASPRYATPVLECRDLRATLLSSAKDLGCSTATLPPEASHMLHAVAAPVSSPLSSPAPMTSPSPVVQAKWATTVGVPVLPMTARG